MTKWTRKPISYIKKGPRSLVSGLFLGFLAAWITAGFILPILPAKAEIPADRIQQGRYCFSATECHAAMTGNAKCQSSEGCCVEDKCFIKGGGCEQAGGDAAGTLGPCYAKSPPIELSVKFGATDTVVDIGDYLAKAYKYAVGLAAFLAAIMMMVGGVIYLTAGDSGRTAKGKAYITDALIGLAVALGAWLMLNTVNPDLISMRLPKVPVAKSTPFIGCTLTELCAPCGESYTVYVDAQGNPPPAGKDGCPWTGTNHTMGEYPGSTCTGKSCYLASDSKESCKDTKTRCRPKADKVQDTVDCGVAGADESDDSGGGYGFVCAVCTQDGGDCSPDGKNDDCCGGFCGAGECSGGQPGDWCDDDKACATGNCQENWGNSCSSGSTGSPCSDKDECAEGYFCQSLFNNTCSPGDIYNWCGVYSNTIQSSECKSGLECKTTNLECTGPLCHRVCLPPGLLSSATRCITDAGCRADGFFTCGDGICHNGTPGSPCDANDECATGFCFEKYAVCTDGSYGTPCTDYKDCESQRCGGAPDNKVCVSGHLGGRCGGSDSPVGECQGDYKCVGSGDHKKCDRK